MYSFVISTKDDELDLPSIGYRQYKQHQLSAPSYIFILTAVTTWFPKYYGIIKLF